MNWRKSKWIGALIAGVPVLFALCAGGGKQGEDRNLTRHELLENLPVSVDGKDSVTVKTIHSGYKNNRYCSLRDLAAALAESPRRFRIDIRDGKTGIVTGEERVSFPGEGSPFRGKEFHTCPMKKNPLEIDGRSLKYITFLDPGNGGMADLYMSLTDVVMQLDLCAEIRDGVLHIDTARPCAISEEILRSPSFCYEIHSMVLGDAETGEVFLAHDPYVPRPIGCSTKLITCAVLLDEIRAGKISMEDTVTIPEEAAVLSRSEDGMIELEANAEAGFRDLLMGMLIPSSNECALALAMHALGSEEAFVAKMKEKAEEAGLSGTEEFYNCHGLPLYTDDIPASKIQNRMCAFDLFQFVQYLLKNCPQILEITSVKEAELSTLHAKVENTNALLFNVPGVIGLKTGTTNMAGCCLTALMKLKDKDGNSRSLTVVELGAEDETIRATLCEELIRFGKQKLLGSQEK